MPIKVRLWNALDFDQSNNTFYGISAFFEHNFSKLAGKKLTGPGELNFFYYIYALKSLNWVLILDARLNDHRRTWTGCFNIFSCDFFLIIDETEFGSYAGDMMQITLLKKLPKIFSNGFSGNEMQGNFRKCHLILSTDETTEMQMGESLI